MSRLQDELCEWTDTVSRKLPPLSKAEAGVLALYSFGMVLVQSCGITSIAVGGYAEADLPPSSIPFLPPFFPTGFALEPPRVRVS